MQWDGKILPYKNQEKVDRLSVLVSGFDFAAKFLGILKHLSGSSLAIASSGLTTSLAEVAFATAPRFLGPRAFQNYDSNYRKN